MDNEAAFSPEVIISYANNFVAMEEMEELIDMYEKNGFGNNVYEDKLEPEIPNLD